MLLDEKCENCKIKISAKVASFSWNRYGKPLCIHCQLDEMKKDTPPKLAKFLEKTIKNKYKV